MKILRFIKWLLIVALAIATINSGVLIYQSDWFQKKYIYPMYFQSEIFQYAQKNSLNPFLVAGVIQTESKFNYKARSPKGAVGLMQVMPSTAKWIAQQLKLEDIEELNLQDPESNIRLGTWYLSELLDEFKQNEILALAAYNGGRGNVKEWMRKFSWTYTFTDINAIPFPETRDFVKRVQKNKAIFQHLYGR